MRGFVYNQEITEWLKQYAKPQRYHAVLCDPPYGIAFMGKHWDKMSPKEFQKWVTNWAELLIPICLPGALGMFFGGTRTFHRLTVGLENAGWRIVDTLMWLHGMGFPKGMDISKAIDNRLGNKREFVGYHSRDNLMKSAKFFRLQGKERCGAIELTAPSEFSAPWSGYKSPMLKPAWEPIILAQLPTKLNYVDLALRYNTGCLNIEGTRIVDKTGVNVFEPSDLGRYPANLILDDESSEMLGTPARFFYTAKANSKEREAGLEMLEKPFLATMGDGIGNREHNSENPRSQVKNHHPTVKPLSLVRWLATMLLPPVQGELRRLLVPFSGSGSEMVGAIQAGWDKVTGVEQDEKYCEIARARLEYWQEKYPKRFPRKLEWFIP